VYGGGLGEKKSVQIARWWGGEWSGRGKVGSKSG